MSPPTAISSRQLSARNPSASKGFSRLALAAVLTSLVVIAVGGATRATDSGLACPTWPGCFTGSDFLPPLSGEFVDSLGRSVTGVNVWLEHSHRLLAGALGLQIAVLLVWVLVSYRHQPGLLWPTVAAAVAVNVQAVLGALVVWNLVQVELVTIHLGLGTATMALMVYLAARSRGSLHVPTEGMRVLWRYALAFTGVLWVQILIGGHLTGVTGGLAYKADPAMGIFSVGPITMEAEAVNVVHRYLAFVVAGLIIWLAIRIKRTRGSSDGSDIAQVRLGVALRWARVAAGLTGLQILLGVANLWSNLSFVSVIPHLAVASWILACMVMVAISLSRRQDLSIDPQLDPAPRNAVEVPA